MTVIYIRWVLSAFLLYGVHGETGTWTTLVLTLVLVNSELQAACDRMRRRKLEKMKGYMEGLP